MTWVDTKSRVHPVDLHDEWYPVGVIQPNAETKWAVGDKAIVLTDDEWADYCDVMRQFEEWQEHMEKYARRVVAVHDGVPALSVDTLDEEGSMNGVFIDWEKMS